MPSPITFLVGGKELVDFKSATVSYAMESFARSFAFEFADKWSRQQTPAALPFGEGDPAQVYVHGELVVDGYVDDVPIDYDASSHRITVSGRSWAGHMVDCSAVHKPGSWRNITIEGIAKTLAEPFGLSVRLDPWAATQANTPATFAKWAIEDEETAYDCLQRAAEARGLFLTDNGQKTIVITKASSIVHPSPLVFGQNIKRARRIGRFGERYSEYIVKHQSSETSFTGEKTTSSRLFRTADPQVLAYRPLVLVSHGTGSKAELERRALWERNVRAGRSRRITYDVIGHRSAAGRVWPVNELVAVQDPWLGTDELLLLASVHLSYDSGGETASLELCRPEAFDVLVPPPQKKKETGLDGMLPG